MTQLSFLWDGITTGDAGEAPYCQDLFNQWASLPVSLPDIPDASDVVGVIPGYLNDLRPQASGSGAYASVVVRSGAAVIRNYMFISTEDVSFAIQPIRTSGYVRLDYIVAELDQDSQTIRLKYIQGVERSTTPYTRALPTEYDSYQVPICWVYVNSTSYVIADELLVDVRRFVSTNKYPYNESPNNLLRNSEFMAYSRQESILGATVDTPECWESEGTCTYYAVTNFPTWPAWRGRSLGLIVTPVNMPAVRLLQKMVVSSDQKTYSVYGTAVVHEYEVGQNVMAVRLRGVRSTGEYTSTAGVCGVPAATLVEFHTVVTFEEDDIEYLELDFYGYSGDSVNGNRGFLGQVLVCEGYHTGPIREIHETIMLKSAATDTSWDGDAKSSATTSISLAASYLDLAGSPLIPAYTHAVILYVEARDSGSAGSATAGIEIRDSAGMAHGKLNLARVPNDYKRAMQIIVPVNKNYVVSAIPVPTFQIVVTATGAATLDATVKIVGIIV